MAPQTTPDDALVMRVLRSRDASSLADPADARRARASFESIDEVVDDAVLKQC